MKTGDLMGSRKSWVVPVLEALDVGSTATGIVKFMTETVTKKGVPLGPQKS